MDLTSFFQEQGIDVFSEVSLDNLSDEDRSSVVQFFPAAQSVIVFGKEVPVPVYRMPPKEKTRGMLRIAEALDNTAVRLAGRLEAEQVPAMPVPLYLPVRIADGRVQGVVRLKQVAAAGGLGSLGRNTVLLTSPVRPAAVAERCRDRTPGPGIPASRTSVPEEKKPRSAKDADAASTYARGEHWDRKVSMRSGAGP